MSLFDVALPHFVDVLRHFVVVFVLLLLFCRLFNRFVSLCTRFYLFLDVLRLFVVALCQFVSFCCEVNKVNKCWIGFGWQISNIKD